jgi:hypothetical protein
VLHNHRHHLGWSDVVVRADAECRVEDPEPFAEMIDADEGISAAHSKEHLFYFVQSTLRCNVFFMDIHLSRVELPSDQYEDSNFFGSRDLTLNSLMRLDAI